MARGQESAFKKARKLEDERAALETKQAEERAALEAKQAEVAKAVAVEAAELIVESKGYLLTPQTLGKIVRVAVEVGEEEALRRLQGAPA